jgi:8-oxo-dGTP pyrophosphatase MutT (NUDIX family)
VTPTIYLGSCPDSDDVIRRLAVKAIAMVGGQVLMLQSGSAGDFKFPGGGVQPGEDAAAALARELDEECGRTLVELGAEALVVVERRPASDRPGAVFEMESRYFYCRVAEEYRPQRLDDYEQELGLRSEWVGLSHAAEVNQRMIDGGRPALWVEREVTVLTWLLEQQQPDQRP